MSDLNKNKQPFSPVLLAAIVLSLLLVGWAFQSTLLSLHSIWVKNNQAYSHGYVLVLFVIYALYTERGWARIAPSYLAIPLGLLVGAVWIAASAVQVLLLQQMVIPVIVLTLLLACVGVKNIIKIWVPLLGLYLAIPIMDVFLSPLQDMTTWAVTLGVRTAGITAFIQDYDIQIPYGILRIADGCAGLNYMLAGLSIGLFYSYLNLTRARDKILAVSLIILLSLVGNWIRVFALVMIGYHSKMQSSLVNEHGFFGWVIFAVLMIGYFIFMEWYTKRINGSSDHVEVKKAVAPQQFRKAAAILMASSIALIVFPTMMQLKLNNSPNTTDAEVYLPPAYERFEASNVSFERWGGQFLGHDLLRGFENQSTDKNEYLIVASYLSQAQGKELIYYANRPAIGIFNERVIETVNGAVNTAEILEGRGRVFWFYSVGGETANTGVATKVLQLKQALTPKPAHAVVLIVECGKECDTVDDWTKSPVIQQLTSITFEP
ncbi:exosortase [Alteromonas facilis]|uniref:exosortase n=1 Tax=Alteromonas facilis TaxID=2048004 RepID=UPI0013D965D2|nr:exosortase [Alteromonas facilis]